MKKRFSTSTVNEGKLGLSNTVEFKPLEDDPSLVLTVERLQNGEAFSYVDVEEKTIDYPKLFRKKVVKIEGLEIETEDGPVKATPKLLTSISDPDFNRIVTATATYIIMLGALNGEEVKNSD